MPLFSGRTPWIARLLYDFPYAMDLTDDMGEPDHDKILPAFTAGAFVFFIFQNPDPSWHAIMAWVIAGGYVYGFSAWRLVASAVSTRIRNGHGKDSPTITLEEGDVNVKVEK